MIFYHKYPSIELVQYKLFTSIFLAKIRRIIHIAVSYHITIERWFSKFFLIYYYYFKLIYLIIFGCVGSSPPCDGFLQLRQAGATLHRGARASHYRGLSCCGAQAPDAQAQQLWLTGPFAPRHVGSSQTRARTHVPCIGRQILNHCATREASLKIFDQDPVALLKIIEDPKSFRLCELNLSIFILKL